MSAVFFNVATVILGTLVGVSVGRYIRDRYHEIIFAAIALSTFAFGVTMIVRGFSELSETSMGDYSLLVIVGSMVLGAFIGEALNIEKGLRTFGEWIQAKVKKIPFLHNREASGTSTFVDGFMTASILYCVGPMTILGSIQAGLGNNATLYLKSMLDGVSAILLSTTLGIGVGFSILPIVVFQGALAAGAHAFTSVFSPAVISSITAVGGILILAISFDILGIKKTRVANMLPALIIVAIIGGILG